MSLQEKMDQACLDALLEVAAILPERIGGVEALLHQRRVSESAPGGGGVEKGDRATKNEAEMLVAFGELVVALGHRLAEGKGAGSLPPLRKAPNACRNQAWVEESKHHSPRGVCTQAEGGQLAHDSAQSHADASKRQQSRQDEVSACSKVLHDHDLLIEVFAFLVDKEWAPAPSTRQCLGLLSLVGQRWRELAHSERYWKPIATAAFPLLALQPSEQSPRWLEPGTRGGYRQFLVEYGRSTVQRRLTRLADWKEGLALNFEVFDRMDGRRLYSAAGPIKVTPIADSNVTSLRLSGPLRQEVTSAFSAADRDPVHKRFATIRDYFKSAHSSDYPAQLSVRITAIDERTGKMALLYEAVKCAKSSAGAQPSTYWQQFLPQGSLDVCDSWVWMQAGEDRPAMEMRVGFFVGPEPNQAGVSDRDRRYRLVARDWHEHQQDASLSFLYFKSLDSLAIGRFIRDCLQ